MRRALRGERLPPPSPKTTALLRTPPTAPAPRGWAPRLPAGLHHEPRGSAPPNTTSRNEARRKDGTKARLRDLGCCERDGGREEKYREKDTFAWSNPGTWKTSRYCLSSAATSLFRAGSERAGGLLISAGVFVLFFFSSPDMLLVGLSPRSLPARVLGLQHPFCRWGGDFYSCFCHALKLSRLRGKEQKEDKSAAALTFEESQEPAARRGNNRR